MNCANCQGENLKEARFCKSCGAQALLIGEPGLAKRRQAEQLYPEQVAFLQGAERSTIPHILIGLRDSEICPSFQALPEVQCLSLSQ